MAATREAPSTPILPPMDPERELRALKNADEAEPAPSDDSANPLGKETYTFLIDRTAGGVRLRGEFTNKILTIEDRANAALLQARMTRNTPWDAIDPEGQFLLQTIAHLTISLAAKPAWFQPATLKDIALLNAVYAEVARHEAFFRGDRPA